MSELSYLEKLLDGVGIDWLPLKNVAEVRSGWGFPNAYQGNSEGDYPFYKVSDMNTIGNETVMSTANNFIDNEIVNKLGIRLAPAGTIIFPKIGAAIATNKKRLLSMSSAYDNNVMGLVTNEKVISRYVFYWVQTINLSTLAHDSGAVPSIRKSEIEALLFPIPCPDNPEKSLEIQSEIVRILDKFTELTAELTAELTMRKKQYNYYRDQLLSFEEGGVEWKTLGDIGEFIRGKRFTKADYVEEGVKVIHYGEIYTRFGVYATDSFSQVRTDMEKSLRYADPGDVVITDVGETVEDVGKAVAWLGVEKVAIHDHCYAFRHSMNPKFVSYCMQTSSFIAEKAKYVARTKVNTLIIKGFSKIPIPVPYPDDPEKSLAEQSRIVTILDKFDTLINSNKEGLPREIELRQKQYEYYRDLLFTFPNPEVAEA
ncbi:TPA: restriction endonuclease subunit S [Raoultella planticola]